jgi:Uma2 family endonuclease
MGGVTIENRRYTVAEYLELERQTGEKFNYYNGYLVPMPGGTISHSRICINVLQLLANALHASSEYEVFGSDQRVAIPEYQLYVYPDVIVVAGLPIRSEHDTQAITNPVLIVEVLSDSTAGYDAGKKFEYLESLPMFREYVLIRQEKPEIKKFFREEADLWHKEIVSGIESEVYFRSIGIGIGLGLIYRRVEFEEP